MPTRAVLMLTRTESTEARPPGRSRRNWNIGHWQITNGHYNRVTDGPLAKSGYSWGSCMTTWSFRTEVIICTNLWTGTGSGAESRSRTSSRETYEYEWSLGLILGPDQEIGWTQYWERDFGWALGWVTTVLCSDLKNWRVFRQASWSRMVFGDGSPLSARLRAWNIHRVNLGMWNHLPTLGGLEPTLNSGLRLEWAIESQERLWAFLLRIWVGPHTHTGLGTAFLGMYSWTGTSAVPDIGTGKGSWFNSVTNPRSRLHSGRGDGTWGCSGWADIWGCSGWAELADTREGEGGLELGFVALPELNGEPDYLGLGTALLAITWEQDSLGWDRRSWPD